MSMFAKIDSDLGRFKDIVRKKVKSDLAKYIGSDSIIGKQGNKLVKIPLKYINIPHFTFGKNGGASQGDGDDGDPINGQGKKKGKGDQAGEGHEDNDFAAEFTPQEMADILRENLELPKLEPKKQGNISTEKTKWNTISSAGSDGQKHFKRTYKEALKRTIGEGTYNFNDPKIIPIHADKRYKASTPVPKPEISAVIMFMIDASGSMDDEKKRMAKALAYWISLLVETSYEKVKTEWIIYDTESSVVNREDFFKASSGGGTQISSGFDKAVELIDTKYDPNDWNIYVVNMSDDENMSSDNSRCQELLQTKLLPATNFFCHAAIVPGHSNGDFTEFLTSNIKDEKLRCASIANDGEDILKAIKTFFAP